MNNKIAHNTFSWIHKDYKGLFFPQVPEECRSHHRSIIQFFSLLQYSFQTLIFCSLLRRLRKFRAPALSCSGPWPGSTNFFRLKYEYFYQHEAEVQAQNVFPPVMGVRAPWAETVILMNHLKPNSSHDCDDSVNQIWKKKRRKKGSSLQPYGWRKYLWYPDQFANICPVIIWCLHEPVTITASSQHKTVVISHGLDKSQGDSMWGRERTWL